MKRNGQLRIECQLTIRVMNTDSILSTGHVPGRDMSQLMLKFPIPFVSGMSFR